MAVYKNREVQITSYITDVSPVVEIQHKDGVREFVNLREVRFTEDEKNDFTKDQTRSVDNVNVIKDKDLQELRDSQDPEKIKAKKDKEPSTTDVPVSKIKVDTKDLKNK